MPDGAVDAHAHVIGAPPEYSFVASRSYTPPPAPPSSYLHMLDATGMRYGVLVQVSVHGTDNRLLLQTLAAHAVRLRGIAVMPLGLAPREYKAAREAGVVGLRLNVLYGGGIGLESLAEYGALAHELGWHLQLLVGARQLAALAPQLSRLPVPFVVDHMGHFPVGEVPLADPAFETLVALARDGAWVKLSGAYRLSQRAPLYEDTIPYAQRLLEAAPTRCLWGSDWPHVAHWGAVIQVGDLLDLLGQWAPDATLREQVLVKNPRVLYGFQ
ncbi:MAG TPA: amidohydrolase family protein [Burkholderiaceae bacterium]|nr:amidohydrolase family protein [Burkholderiaceae bacterium]